MLRYHINSSGEPGECRAEIACPFGGEENHHPTPSAARAAYEVTQAALGKPVRKKPPLTEATLGTIVTDGTRFLVVRSTPRESDPFDHDEVRDEYYLEELGNGGSPFTRRYSSEEAETTFAIASPAEVTKAKAALAQARQEHENYEAARASVLQAIRAEKLRLSPEELQAARSQFQVLDRKLTSLGHDRVFRAGSSRLQEYSGSVSRLLSSTDWEDEASVRETTEKVSLLALRLDSYMRVMAAAKGERKAVKAGLKAWATTRATLLALPEKLHKSS